jgi:alkylation response protein AidB-like acyl-CoA dehydrogenase
LKGELFAAECLTEPRGGSDFFGTTTLNEDKGDYYLLNGQKRFIVGGEGPDYFLVYARQILMKSSMKGELVFLWIKARVLKATIFMVLCGGGEVGQPPYI